jgi:hypothetical protein
MPPPEKLPTWEAFDQVIVSNHGDYKWPVFLYKINEKKFGCYAAKLWVEEKLSTLGFDTEYKSSFHTTEGFLKDGDYLTFAVLHNAVDPFRCGDSITTTTFGFCGSSPDELRWKTIMPCLRLKVEKWEAEGSIQQIKLWHPGLPPAERRFHRAYWLAANKRPLGGLLNRAKTDDLPTQVPESSEPEAALIYSDKMNANVLSDTDLEFDDSDVTNDGIDISSEEAAGIWQKCLEELRSDLPSVNHPSTVGLSPSD